DDEIAGSEERRHLAEASVDRRLDAARDHQPDAVAPPTPGLGRLVRLQRGRQLELQGGPVERRRAHRVTSSPTAWRPLGRAPSTSVRTPGPLSSGGGRSEMSSPGNASWCISVRMSPGSTQYTFTPVSSAARTLDSCSRAAFDDP